MISLCITLMIVAFWLGVGVRNLEMERTAVAIVLLSLIWFGAMAIVGVLS